LTIKLLDGLHYLEDIYDPTYLRNLRQKEKTTRQEITAIVNSKEEILIKWEL